jgi:glycosyltransferase involved in cell wall biosynthesis
MSPPLISAVIPTYNYGRFVTEAVESVLAQTYAPVEVIVVDDGSTDDTRERLRPFADRIRYIYQDNQGLSAARNTGIRAARGDLIGLLDSDDQWHPLRLETQMRYLSAHPATALVAADSQDDLHTGWAAIGDPAGIPVQPIAVRDLLVRARFGPGGVLVRKECFDAVGFFDTTLRSAEDRDMWIRIASRYPIVKLKAPLWMYRTHPGSMSTAAVRMEDNELRVLQRALDREEVARGDTILRRRVLSYTLKSSAYRYDALGLRGRAVARLIRSMLLWPFPYRPDERITPLERPKMLALFLLRMARAQLGRVGSASKPYPVAAA